MRLKAKRLTGKLTASKMFCSLMTLRVHNFSRKGAKTQRWDKLLVQTNEFWSALRPSAFFAPLRLCGKYNADGDTTAPVHFASGATRPVAIFGTSFECPGARAVAQWPGSTGVAKARQLRSFAETTNK
jgi:hypothetical protein